MEVEHVNNLVLTLEGDEITVFSDLVKTLKRMTGVAGFKKDFSKAHVNLIDGFYSMFDYGTTCQKVTNLGGRLDPIIEEEE